MYSVKGKSVYDVNFDISSKILLMTLPGMKYKIPTMSEPQTSEIVHEYNLFKKGPITN